MPDIFKQEHNVKLSTPKRKRDSPEDHITTKLRRMTVGDEGSPTLRKHSLTKTRKNLTTRKNSGTKNKTVESDGTKQLLISQFLGGKDKSS